MGTKQSKKLSIKKFYQKKLKELQKKEEILSDLKLKPSKKDPLQSKIQAFLDEKNSYKQEIKEITQKLSSHEENSVKQLEELEEQFAELEEELSVIKQKIKDAEKVDVILYEAGIKVQPEPGLSRVILSEEYQEKWNFPRVVWLSDKAIAKGEPYPTLDWMYENWHELVEQKKEQIQTIKDQKSRISQWKKDSKKTRKKMERELKRKEKKLRKLLKELSEKRADHQKLDTFDKLSNEVELAKELLALFQEKKSLVKDFKREVRKIERKLWMKDETRNKELIGNKLWNNWSKAFLQELFISKKIIQPVFAELFAEEKTAISGSSQFLKQIVFLPQLLQRKLNKLWDWLDRLIEESSEGEINYLYLNQGYFNISWLLKQRIKALTKVYENIYLTDSLETVEDNPFILIRDSLTKKQQAAFEEGANNFNQVMMTAFKVHEHDVQQLFSKEQRIHDQLAYLQHYLDQINEIPLKEDNEKELLELIKKVQACDCAPFKQEYLQPLYETMAAIEDSAEELKNNAKLLKKNLKGINKWQKKIDSLKQKERAKKAKLKDKAEEEEEADKEQDLSQRPKLSQRPAKSKVTPEIRKEPVKSKKPSKPRSSQSKGKIPEICPRCGGKIVESSTSYNDFLGTEVAELVCENHHKEIIYLD